jgi:hypothetical protein
VKLAHSLPFVSAAFLVFDALAVEFNLALLEPPKAGPAMYWYGWIETSALGACRATFCDEGVFNAQSKSGS